VNLKIKVFATLWDDSSNET